MEDKSTKTVLSSGKTYSLPKDGKRLARSLMMTIEDVKDLYPEVTWGKEHATKRYKRNNL